ncbi:unnamed protein product [Dimorphilus gyrociliatus]|uniref:Uncharacterized protein n=1 Tax=Dimorphilus gyrociliatus TaxID=2664684 RepID=A0A7I8VF05_9ANNE|nr:unnamed protein product [Dimorphilus gyrociliatus]
MKFKEFVTTKFFRRKKKNITKTSLYHTPPSPNFHLDLPPSEAASSVLFRNESPIYSSPKISAVGTFQRRSAKRNTIAASPFYSTPYDSIPPRPVSEFYSSVRKPERPRSRIKTNPWIVPPTEEYENPVKNIVKNPVRRPTCGIFAPKSPKTLKTSGCSAFDKISPDSAVDLFFPYENLPADDDADKEVGYFSRQEIEKYPHCMTYEPEVSFEYEDAFEESLESEEIRKLRKKFRDEVFLSYESSDHLFESSDEGDMTLSDCDSETDKTDSESEVLVENDDNLSCEVEETDIDDDDDISAKNRNRNSDDDDEEEGEQEGEEEEDKDCKLSSADGDSLDSAIEIVDDTRIDREKILAQKCVTEFRKRQLLQTLEDLKKKLEDQSEKLQSSTCSGLISLRNRQLTRHCIAVCIDARECPF